ncbi:hypothetical protein ACFV0O_00795 [Kitasatospora sp. NPDC059577]|uniref:hypothetical protein n=1 Tax=Kitasatospora sp. NPDC059577 TaxID=3346873 RepID=UPI00368143EC
MGAWRAGSRKLMTVFAEHALRDVPAGSPLAGIQPHALRERSRRFGLSALPTSRAAKDRRESVARSSDLVPDDDRRVQRLRHLPARLLKARRFDTALEQVR